MGSTTKTMVELLVWTDGKRRGFFVMKRTAGLIFVASFFQLYATINDIHNVGTNQ